MVLDKKRHKKNEKIKSVKDQNTYSKQQKLRDKKMMQKLAEKKSKHAKMTSIL